jgi:hypothetical protein
VVLSKRERLVAIIVIAGILLLVLDHYVLEPYLSERDRISTNTAQAIQDQNDANALLTRQARLKKIWAEMQNGGLKIDDSQAESLTLEALLAWSQNSRVPLPAIKRERSVQEGKFEVIGFDISGTGNMPEVSRLVWAVETATIPVRINEMQITPQKEGIDNLSVRLSISALCMPPAKDNKVASAASLGGGSQ